MMWLILLAIAAIIVGYLVWQQLSSSLECPACAANRRAAELFAQRELKAKSSKRRRDATRAYESDSDGDISD